MLNNVTVTISIPKKVYDAIKEYGDANLISVEESIEQLVEREADVN